MERLVKDMSEEMKSWGHQGGDGGHIILKSDGERSIVALRTALAKFHGRKVVPEDPPRGESQSNGTAEEAGKTVREFVRVPREHAWQEMQDPSRGVRREGVVKGDQARSAPTSWRASGARGFGWDTAAGRTRPSSGRVKVWSEPTLSSAWMRRAAGTPSISRR